MVQAHVLGAQAVAQHQPGDEDPDRPAGQHQIGEERREREAERPQIEAEERDRQQRHRHHADREPHQAHDHQRGDELDRPQRRHHQVAEIARPHLLEERDREAELAAKQDVPQQHRADEGAAGAREEAGVLRRLQLQEAPHQHLHGRPVDEVEEARPRRAQQVPIAQHHGGDAARRKVEAGCRCRSSRRLAPSRAARDVEEHLFQRVRGRSARAAAAACRRPRCGPSS